MRYLYGDSTSSDLDVNFIEFVRDAVEFCVQALQADQRAAQGRAHIRTLEQSTAAEMERLQKLPPLVTKAFEAQPLGAADSATARCAAAIANAASELARAEAGTLRSLLETEVGKQNAQALREREGTAKALETLLLRHNLPETSLDVQLLLRGGHYETRALARTGSGLEAILDLEVPGNHLFERVVRVDRLMERLDVHAPEIGGWLHKEVKQRLQHLDKQHVTELSVSRSGGAVKLRAGADGSGVGFDATFSRQPPRVRMARVDQDGSVDQPFDVDEADAKPLLVFYDKLAAAAVELNAHRRKLVDTKLDGEALRTHPKPTVLVERLIAAMAPVVQEIAARSQTPGELVLRRLIGDDRREEIFLSKSDLKQKLEPLGDANRALFEPLWLSTPQAKLMASGPAPAAEARRDAPRGRVTPPLGTSPLATATANAAATAAAAAAPPSMPPGPAPRSRLPTPAGGTASLDAPPPGPDMFRRTLVGATVNMEMPAPDAAAKPAADAAAKPAGDSAPKPPPPAPPPRTEANGTIDVKQAGKIG
jgi:hypothetical protein